MTVETDDEPEFDDYGGGLGCVHCGYAGWHHGCMDDMCRACTEPEDCPDGRPCRHCNPDGEVVW